MFILAPRNNPLPNFVMINLKNDRRAESAQTIYKS